LRPTHITRQLVLLVGLVGLVGLGACKKSESTEPTDRGATEDESTLRAQDRAKLEQLVPLDVQASRAMKDADDATRTRDAGAALDVVAKRAAPAIDEARRAVEGATMRTAWGSAKRDELAAILRDRQAEIPRYEEAIREGDPEKMLEVVRVQASIERRAIATVATVKEGR